MLAQMLESLKRSFGSFGPALFLILMTVYLFGVALMQGVTVYVEQHKSTIDPAVEDELQTHFGSSTLVCWTLLGSIAGGYDWGAIAWSLTQVGTMYVVFFLLFILFTIFCLLNILTAIFVNCAHQASTTCYEIATDAAVAEKRFFTTQLIRLF